MIDEIDNVVWRPYRDCEEWEDDAVELPYVFQSRYLIGSTPYIIEKHLIERVCSQFERIHRIPWGSRMYAQTVRDQVHLRPLLLYDQAMTQMLEMVPMPWDIWVDVEDAGMDARYTAYWVEHLFPRLTDPGEPIEEDGGGRGRRRRWGVVAERRVAQRRDGGEERQVHVVRGRGGLPL